MYSPAPTSRDLAKQELFAIFTLLDLNGEQDLDLSEFTRGLRSMEIDMDDEEITAIFNAIDADGNDYVDEESFQTWLEEGDEELIERLRVALRTALDNPGSTADTGTAGGMSLEDLQMTQVVYEMSRHQSEAERQGTLAKDTDVSDVSELSEGSDSKSQSDDSDDGPDESDELLVFGDDDGGTGGRTRSQSRGTVEEHLQLPSDHSDGESTALETDTDAETLTASVWTALKDRAGDAPLDDPEMMEQLKHLRAAQIRAVERKTTHRNVLRGNDQSGWTDGDFQDVEQEMQQEINRMIERERRRSSSSGMPGVDAAVAAAVLIAGHNSVEYAQTSGMSPTVGMSGAAAGVGIGSGSGGGPHGRQQSSLGSSGDIPPIPLGPDSHGSHADELRRRSSGGGGGSRMIPVDDGPLQVTPIEVSPMPGLSPLPGVSPMPQVTATMSGATATSATPAAIATQSRMDSGPMTRVVDDDQQQLLIAQQTDLPVEQSGAIVAELMDPRRNSNDSYHRTVSISLTKTEDNDGVIHGGRKNSNNQDHKDGGGGTRGISGSVNRPYGYSKGIVHTRNMTADTTHVSAGRPQLHRNASSQVLSFMQPKESDPFVVRLVKWYFSAFWDEECSKMILYHGAVSVFAFVMAGLLALLIVITVPFFCFGVYTLSALCEVTRSAANAEIRLAVYFFKSVSLPKFSLYIPVSHAVEKMDRLKDYLRDPHMVKIIVYFLVIKVSMTFFVSGCCLSLFSGVISIMLTPLLYIIDKDQFSENKYCLFGTTSKNDDGDTQCSGWALKSPGDTLLAFLAFLPVLPATMHVCTYGARLLFKVACNFLTVDVSNQTYDRIVPNHRRA